MSAASAWRISKERSPDGALWLASAGVGRASASRAPCATSPRTTTLIFSAVATAGTVAAQTIVDAQFSVDLGKMAGRAIAMERL